MQHARPIQEFELPSLRTEGGTPRVDHAGFGFGRLPSRFPRSPPKWLLGLRPAPQPRPVASTCVLETWAGLRLQPPAAPSHRPPAAYDPVILLTPLARCPSPPTQRVASHCYTTHRVQAHQPQQGRRHCRRRRRGCHRCSSHAQAGGAKAGREGGGPHRRRRASRSDSSSVRMSPAQQGEGGVCGGGVMGGVS